MMTQVLYKTKIVLTLTLAKVYHCVLGLVPASKDHADDIITLIR